MDSLFDFTAYDQSGNLAVVVVAHARRAPHVGWARRFRANLMESSSVPRGAAEALFLLVTPAVYYLWRADSDEFVAYASLSDTALGPYFVRAGLEPDGLVDPIVWRAVVSLWLSDLAAGRAPTDEFLVRTGLAEILRGGEIVVPSAA